MSQSDKCSCTISRRLRYGCTREEGTRGRGLGSRAADGDHSQLPTHSRLFEYRDPSFFPNPMVRQQGVPQLAACKRCKKSSPFVHSTPTVTGSRQPSAPSPRASRESDPATERGRSRGITESSCAPLAPAPSPPCP